MIFVEIRLPAAGRDKNLFTSNASLEVAIRIETFHSLASTSHFWHNRKHMHDFREKKNTLEKIKGLFRKKNKFVGGDTIERQAPKMREGFFSKEKWQRIWTIVKERRLWWKLPVVFLVIPGFLIGGYLFYKATLAAKSIVNENLTGAAPALSGKTKPTQLKGEGDGRINFLLLGIGGEGHSGTYLTDTIQIVSIDPEEHHTAMLSIPRDLYVKMPGSNGYSKINEVYTQGLNQKKCVASKTKKCPDDEQINAAAAYTKDTIGDLLDMDIHYYALVDFNGFKQIIDAVGGITVNVEKDLVDYQYPNEKENGYETFKVKAGTQTMNGTTALKYSRSRHSTSDFDRAKRQQQVMVATKDKVMSSQTLLNPKKLAEVFSALGTHMRTDLQLSEMEKLLTMAKDFDSKNVATKVLDNSKDSVLVSGTSPGGAYILKPKNNDYSLIASFAHELFTDVYIKKEAATIELQNGTTKSGLATDTGKLLTSYGYNVVNMTKADKTDYPKTTIYDCANSKKPYTVTFLKKRFNNADVKKCNVKEPKYDIIVVIGKDYTPTKILDYGVKGASSKAKKNEP